MKKQTTLLLIALLAVPALASCGVLREPEAASGPIEAIPLASRPAGMVDATAEEATGSPAEGATGAAIVFTIDQSASQVRFQLDEDLRGRRTTVVGTTDQVAGELSLNFADLSQVQVGTIQINARTLKTDNNMRNRTIQNEILDTGSFEFITFTPTGIEGLPAGVTIGETVSFSLVGDLTIRDITMPATFTVVATAVSDSQITGTATSIVKRADYGLRIPSVPNVANVEEEVELYIDFTANAS